jgi:hypothetical protein
MTDTLIDPISQQSPQWHDFNDADPQLASLEPIPRGSILPVRMTITPGAYSDEQRGWEDGYATEQPSSGSIYLRVEFAVIRGPHAKRKIWGNIGLFSRKGPGWARMGRSMIRAILNSARNLHPTDQSPGAILGRQIQGFKDLDGLEFLVQLEIEKDTNGQERNVILQVIEPNHQDYARLMALPPVQAPKGEA